jgi:hypothetical protein
VGPNPVCLHPSPEAAQHHTQQLALPSRWPAEKPWACRRAVFGRTSDLIGLRMAGVL